MGIHPGASVSWVPSKQYMGDFVTLSVSTSWLLATREAGVVIHIPRAHADVPDDQLIVWSAAGDSKAFDEIVFRHGPFALRVARRLAPDHTHAQDVVQEAMVRAWTQAGKFDPQRALFTTWLYRIIVNLCIDERRRMRPGPLPVGYDLPDPATSAAEQMEIEQRARALASALLELPPRQRAAMTLVYDEGLSGGEAASVLGLSAKAVERLLARGRAFLRSRLSGYDGDGGSAQ
jgi:RNA polymerase sigma-70 factor (ECF subfamily)